MAELGIIAATGMTSIQKLILVLRDPEDTRLPVAARAALLEMAEQIEMLTARIEKLDVGSLDDPLVDPGNSRYRDPARTTANPARSHSG